MTEQVDLDALIAEVRAWTREDADAAPRNLRRLALVVADALEQSQAEVQRLHAVMGRGFVETLKDRDEAYAELRQERERADGLEANRRLWIADAFEYESAALSRAEETIEKVRAVAQNPYEGYRGESVVSSDELRTILATYDQQT